MLRFYAAVYTVAMRSLADVTARLSMERWAASGDKEAVGFKDQINRALADLNHPQVSGGLPLSRLLRVKIERLTKRMETDERLTVSQAESLLKDLHNDIVIDLSSSLFLAIPSERVEFFFQSQPPFGEQVADTFPDANNDIAAAGRCFALDEWTAAVFHLMRVLEHGLHWLAGRVGLSVSSDLGLENWKNIIDQIEKEIRKLEATPKGPEKSEALRFLSEAASNFRYFKDAWRNHVSHSRATYDERQALAVWNHVRQFMQVLAGASDL